MSIELVMPSKHLVLYHVLLLLTLIFPSIRVFFNESVLCIRWYWSFSFSMSPSNEYLGLTGLISLLYRGLSRVFSSITIWKHQWIPFILLLIYSIQPSTLTSQLKLFLKYFQFYQNNDFVHKIFCNFMGLVGYLCFWIVSSYLVSKSYISFQQMKCSRIIDME